jgi:recombination protein RecA
VTTGGRALKFYSSIRLELRRSETIKQGSEAIGSRVKAKVVKNKVAPPFRAAEFDIMFDHGISKEGNLLDVGLESGLIGKAGAFFSYGDIRLGQGRESARQYLRENPVLAQEIEGRIRASAGTVRLEPSSEQE